MAKVKAQGKKSSKMGSGGGSYLVPETGWYEAEIAGEEVKENNNKNGSHLNMEFHLTQGGKCWFIFNHEHDEDEPRRIALEQLEHLIYCAVGDGKKISDTKKLKGRKLMLLVEPQEVTKKQKKKGWKDKNLIKDFAPVGEHKEEKKKKKKGKKDKTSF